MKDKNNINELINTKADDKMILRSFLLLCLVITGKTM